MKRVEIIPAIKHTSNHKLRVAAYCRVSTSMSQQQSSYHTQKEYYENLISKNEKWTLSSIYADEGISGTSLKNRASFARMIEDCEQRLIDKIITKSVTRFARNTIDTLNTVRKLKQLGISVLFEKENLDTADETSEVMLSVLASVAQEESLNISKNMRWSIQKRMKSGEWIPSSIAYGYQVVNKCITEAPQEAKIVKDIFKMYLNGLGSQKIADILNQDRITAPRNAQQWNGSSVLSILKNPIYTGRMVGQKTYTTETIPFIRKVNHGEVAKVHYVNNHKVIVSEVMFEKAKQISQYYKSEKGNDSAHSTDSISKSALSGKVKCRYSGATLKRAKAYCNKPNEYIVYRTSKSKNYKGIQQSLNIRESEIHKLFETMVYKLKYYPEVLNTLSEDLLKASSSVNPVRITREEIDEQMFILMKEFNSNQHMSAFYIQEMNRLQAIKLSIQENPINEFDRLLARTKTIKQSIDSLHECKYSEELFESIVSMIWVTKDTVTFELVNLLQLMEVR